MKILGPDPLRILSSTQKIVETAQWVTIHERGIAALAERVEQRFREGLNTLDQNFGSTNRLEDDLQLIFIENTVNFCFWPDPGSPRWEVEWPKGTRVSGGWYALSSCFKRALQEGLPILDAQYLSTLSNHQAHHLFRGIDGIEIPLFEKRVENLRETGRILLEQFDGQCVRMLEAVDYDAIRIVSLIIESFPSFRDISLLDQEHIFFLKRAQISSNDFAYALKGRSRELTRLSELTAFADYKLPQILRLFGVLSYADDLAHRIDAQVLIPHDTREEIEIRAATIWAVELLKRRIPSLTAAEIDNVIWLLSQTMQSEAKPYHRTRTIYY